MEQFKGTPAPWWIEATEDETVIEAASQTVCRDVSNCDADLIAAAPELLEALQKIVELTDRNHIAWIKAHVAIRKALNLKSCLQYPS